MLRTVFSAGHALYAPDRRDFVFALIGLAKDTEKLSIRADYTKSCAEVFFELIYALLKNGDLEILSYCHYPSTRADLPSWVPDWSSVLVPSRCGSPTRLFHVRLSSIDRTAEIVLSPNDSMVLRVRGFRVDVVSCPGPLQAESKRNADQCCAEWIHFLQSS